MTFFGGAQTIQWRRTSTLMNQVKQVKGEFVNNPDGTTSYYDAITGVKLVDTSLVVDGQTFNVDAKGKICD